MPSARRVGRWALIGVVVLVGVVALLRVGVGVYLRSSGGRAMVARQLQQAIGLPVEVTGVDLGSPTSELKFRVLDPTTGAEVMAVESARADVTLLDAVAGRVAPKELHLTGASLTLQLGADGKLRTTMPTPTAGDSSGPPPRVVIENAKVRVQQEGRPEFALDGLRLTAEPAGGKLTLTGSIDDKGWGKWGVAGEIDPAAKTGWVELTTTDGSVHVERLRSIPGLSASIWQHVRPDGRAAARVRLGVAAGEKFVYDVEIKPAAAALTFPDAKATLTGVTGTIRVHEGKLDLSDCRGALAGGVVAASGTWEYGPEPSVATVRVTADKLAVKDLPKEWNLDRLKPQLGGLFEDVSGGTLRGDANLRLVLHANGGVEPYGDGLGVLEVPVAGGSATVAVRLHGNGKLLEFGHTPMKSEKTFTAETQRAQSQHGEETERNPVPSSSRLSALLGVLCASVVNPVSSPQPPPKADAENTVSATINLKDIDIGQLLEKLQTKVPYKVAGRVSVRLAVGVPLDQAGTSTAYKFTGTFSSPELRLEGLTVRDLSAAVEYQNGKLTLTALKGTIPQAGGVPGGFAGTASVAVDPPGDAAASLTLDRLPLGEVLRAVPGFATDVRGVLSGKAAFRAPYEKLADPATWAATADVRSDELSALGRTAKAVHLAVVVEKGVARLTNAAVTIEGIPVTAAATVALTGEYRYEATLHTKPLAVSDFRKLIPEADLAVPVEGLLETEATAKGTLTPFTVTAGGSVRASKLSIGKTAANHIRLKWGLTADRLTVSDLSAELFDGTLSGSADVPFDARKAGAFGVEFKNLDAAAAAALVPDFPVKLTGRVSGKVGGTIPPAEPNQPRTATADVALSAPKLTVQGIPAEKLEGKFGVGQGAFAYELTGHTLGGTFEVKGKYPGGKKPAPDPKGERGSVRLTGLDLARLGAVGGPSLAPLAGTLDLTFDYANDLSSGSGRVVVRGLAFGGTTYSQEISGLLLMRDGVAELLDFGGPLAGGFARGRARVHVRTPARNFFLLTIDRADPKRLLAAVPEVASELRGELSVRVLGNFGREPRVTGTVTLARGSVAGLGVSELRVPFTVTGSPGGYGRLVVHDIGGQAGAGTVQGQLTYNWGHYENRLDGRFQFTNLRLQAVSSSLGESGLFAGGRINGRVEVSGTNVKTAADLNATVLATLVQTSVRDLPVFSVLTPYLNPAGLVRPFESGDLRGRLTNGVFRISRLALHSSNAQLFADGTVTTRGTLDLNVAAHTGTIGPESPGLRALGLRIPALGPVPITLIRDVSDFLSNRTVRLTVTGTTASPVVRVNTAALLTEEAARFFVSRYVPADIAAVLGFGTGVGGVVGGLKGDR